MSSNGTGPATPFAEDEMEGFVGPERRRLPDERRGFTHKFNIAGTEGYITANAYEDGSLGEIFLTGIGQEGSTLRGLMDGFAIMFSLALQHGASLDMIARKLAHMRFDPHGATDNPDVPEAHSLFDYIARYLAERFGDDNLRADMQRIDEKMRAAAGHP